MQPEIRLHFNTGREHYLAAEYDKAEQHLRAVVEEHDGFADVHNMLGVSLQHLGRTKEAVVHFERAVALDPAYTEAALNLSVCYNELGRYDEAKAVYERAAAGRSAAGPGAIAFGDPAVAQQQHPRHRTGSRSNCSRASASRSFNRA